MIIAEIALCVWIISTVPCQKRCKRGLFHPSPRRSCHNICDPMTERLYYTDSYLREFQARVVERSDDGRTVYLDRSAFYPTSGGQPFDIGSIGGVAVVEVVDEDDRIAHRLAAPFAGDGERVSAAVDWA